MIVMKIRKTKSNNAYIIELENASGIFSFIFAGTLDLYISYYGTEDSQRHSIEIDKNNFFLYKCFNELYDSISNEKPFAEEESSLLYKHDQFLFPLLINGIIEWHSDDALYDDAAILYVEKLDESYRMTIQEGLVSDINMKTKSVRFRNSGSIYEPYNYTFMSLYNKLCNHNFEYEQITIDEYIDRIKIRKR